MGSPNPGGGKPLFVGRDAELAVLMAGLDDARAGRGRFVALVGEAGIGKTRTLEEFVARAGLPDERIWWGSCPEQPGLPAYWPWTQAIGRYVERCDAEALARGLGGGAADLAPLIPEIEQRLGRLEPPLPCDPAQARLRLFSSFATFLRRTAENEPLVVVLDDLHWADEGSILLLALLAPELRRSRTLLVGTYRERQTWRLPRLLGPVARVSERIALRGLTLYQVGTFVRNALDALPGTGLVARLQGPYGHLVLVYPRPAPHRPVGALRAHRARYSQPVS